MPEAAITGHAGPTAMPVIVTMIATLGGVIKDEYGIVCFCSPSLLSGEGDGSRLYARTVKGWQRHRLAVQHDVPLRDPPDPVNFYRDVFLVRRQLDFLDLRSDPAPFIVD